jgi:two-component system C4-dicarboxylate transport response regulator DctD
MRHELNGQVFVIDDDSAMRAAIVQSLTLAELSVEPFADSALALAALTPDFFGIIVSDLRMPRMDGLEVHRQVRAIDAEIPVILITGHGDIEQAVQAMHAGAHDFVAKPFATERLTASVMRALRYRRLVLDNRALALAAAARGPDIPISGNSAAAKALRAAITNVAATESNVLIEGEPGTGKEHVARTLHAASRRGRRAFSIVECGAIPDAAIAHILYGGMPASGIAKRQMGLIEAADGGTLFLHDLELASPALQTHLARVLEVSAIPSAGNDVQPVSLRVIAATCRDLTHLMDQGAFRKDLHYALTRVRIRVPPLRERRDDILDLFSLFQVDAARRLGKCAPAMSELVRRHLFEHHWPGNARELQSFAERTVLGVENASLSPYARPQTLPERVDDFEASVIRQALRAHAGDVRSTLSDLQIPRKTFYDKVRRYGIDLDSFRAGSSDGHT